MQAPRTPPPWMERIVAETYRTDDWDEYRMDYGHPHARLEPAADEIAVVHDTLAALQDAGVLAHTDYDHDKFDAMRQAVAERFEIPWSAITPRMHRLLYAVNAIAQPRNMIAAGVFCGFTFISNAAAGVGLGACYSPDELIGVEIKPDEAERAERNVRTVDPTGTARVVAADAVTFVAEYAKPIHLLYLDADGGPQTGKGIYLDILRACYDKLADGALVLAHNSVNAAGRLAQYFDFVRDPDRFRQSVNVILDPEGLEVSVK